MFGSYLKKKGEAEIYLQFPLFFGGFCVFRNFELAVHNGFILENVT